MGMKYRDPNTGQLKELSLKAADTLPIGSVIAYSGSNEPSGWLICDGRAISRTSYSNLFNVIGTTYGAGDGSTTFNLPDYRDRVPVGLDSNDSDFDTLGKTGGEKTHKLTISEIPSHGHNIMTRANWSSTNNTVGALSRSTTSNGTDELKDGSVFGARATGGGQSHNNLQPYIVINYIIKAEKSVGVLGKILNLFSNSDKDSYSCKYINDTYGGGIKNYSTDEVKLNEKWIDGKPLYRKTIIVTNDSTLTQITVQHNIQNLNEVTDIRGSIKTYTSWKPITNIYIPNVAEYSVAIYNITAKEKNFQILVGATLAREKAFTKAYVTLEYTKTTD